MTAATSPNAIKVYRAGTEGEGRYSPAEVASVETVLVIWSVRKLLEAA